jgi:hypothetical protein
MTGKLGRFSGWFVLGAALAIAGCGDEEHSKKPPATPLDGSEQAKIETGRRKLDQASEATNNKEFDRARKLLNEAHDLGVESQRFEVEEALERLDKREAKLFANEAAEKLAAKDCKGAFKDLSSAMKEKQSDAFTRELRKLVAADAGKCVQAFVDEAVLGMNYADARALVAAPTTKDVLGATAQKKIDTELAVTIEESLKAQLQDDLKAKKWDKAVAKVDAAVKRGDADDTQGASLLGAVREAALPEALSIANKGIGGRDAAAALKQIDALVKLLRWELVTGDAAAIDQKAMPEALARKYRALATWVEAARVTLKPLKKPEKRWAHGKIGVASPMKSDVDAKRDVLHGSEVWVIGQSKDKALVVDKDPGTETKLAVLLESVLGWVPTEHLAKESTADWIVPDDQLKGERVWGPLRGSDPAYELGIVTEVSGKEVSVKRLADDQVAKVPRAKLRSGRLAVGTRVLTFCTAKDQPAKILEVLPTGSAKLKCDGGEEKEEVFASLRSKAELLPASK